MTPAYRMHDLCLCSFIFDGDLPVRLMSGVICMCISCQPTYILAVSACLPASLFSSPLICLYTCVSCLSKFCAYYNVLLLPDFVFLFFAMRIVFSVFSATMVAVPPVCLLSTPCVSFRCLLQCFPQTMLEFLTPCSFSQHTASIVYFLPPCPSLASF